MLKIIISFKFFSSQHCPYAKMIMQSNGVTTYNLFPPHWN